MNYGGWEDVSKVFLPLWTIMWGWVRGEGEGGRKGIHFIMSPTVNTLNIPTQIKPIFGVNVY